MNDKDIKKTIDNIVWWIPNRKLRDFIREIYYKIENNDKSIKDINNYIENINNSISQISIGNNKIPFVINFISVLSKYFLVNSKNLSQFGFNNGSPPIKWILFTSPFDNSDNLLISLSNTSIFANSGSAKFEK